MQQDDVIVLDFSKEEADELDRQYKEGISNFIKQTQAYRLSNWYGQLKPFTARTVNRMLSAGEAYTLYLSYYGQPIPQGFQEILKNLPSRIDTVIEQQFPGGCFLKLSTRSPKDFSWDFREEAYRQATIKKLVEYIRSRKMHEEPCRQATLEQCNWLYIFLMEYSRERSKIRTGQDFIKIFTKSQRIVIDLENLSTSNGYLFRKFKEGDLAHIDEPLIEICFREWKDFLWQNEFRCFYYDYKLRGICPYEQDCYFENWKNKHAELLTRIGKYFSLVLPRLQKCELDKGVIDVFFSNDLQHIEIIQVNPFDRNTRASLFDWDKDEKQLTSGQVVDVRLRSQPSERIRLKLGSIMGMIQKGSSDVINQALKLSESHIFID